MMSISNFSELILAVGAIIGVFVWGLGGKSRSNTIAAVMQENTSLRGQLGDVKTELEVTKTRAEKSEKNEQYLKDIAQSKPDFSKLLQVNTNLSVQLTTQHKEILTSFKGLTDSVTTLATTIAKERRDG